MNKVFNLHNLFNPNIFNGRSSDSSQLLFAFPSGVLAGQWLLRIKSYEPKRVRDIQQRVLSLIQTGFPFHLSAMAIASRTIHCENNT